MCFEGSQPRVLTRCKVLWTQRKICFAVDLSGFGRRASQTATRAIRTVESSSTGKQLKQAKEFGAEEHGMTRDVNI